MKNEIANAFGSAVMERITDKVQAQRALGGDPVTTFAREVAISDFVDELVHDALDPIAPERREAARRIAKAAVRMLDTADPIETIASIGHELHIAAYAIGGAIAVEAEKEVPAAIKPALGPLSGVIGVAHGSLPIRTEGKAA